MYDFFTKAGFWFTCVAMTSGAAVCAESQEIDLHCSHSCSGCHLDRHEVLRLFNTSEIAATLYTERLGLTVLWASRPYADSQALINSYDSYIFQNASTLESVFRSLGGHANGVAQAFYNLATAAQAFAASNTPANQANLAAAGNALSAVLSNLSCHIDSTYVTNTVNSIVNDIGAFYTYSVGSSNTFSVKSEIHSSKF